MPEMQKNTRIVKNIIGAAVMSGVILADQLSKYIVSGCLEMGESIPLIKGVFNITYITNKGAAFGMMADNRWIFMILSTVAIAAMIAYIGITSAKLSVPVMVSLGMIIGGGIGNMIDRIFNGAAFGDGEVIDFLDFCLFPSVWQWIFNVADAAICVGAGLFIVIFITDEIKHSSQAKKEAKAVPEASAQPGEKAGGAASGKTDTEAEK